MKNLFAVILILSSISSCLRAKRSNFDLSSPSSFLIGFGIINFLNSSTPVSIGGSIEGHIDGGDLVLKNGTEEKRIQQNAGSYKFQVKQNSNYSISVSTNPISLQCSVSNGTGIATVNKTDINITCTKIEIASPFGNLGKNWNEYIERDYAKSLLTQTGTACTATNPLHNNYFSCIHAAEIRVFELSSNSNCVGITIEDNANLTGGAFEWICRPEPNGKIKIHSIGFRNGDLGDLKNNPPPGLSDLIDWTLTTPAFKKLKVTVKENSLTIFETATATWWGNSFVHNPTSASLNQVGTIYTFANANQDFDAQPVGNGYSIAANQVSVVVRPGRKIFNSQAAASGTLLGQPANVNFSWIEGEFNGIKNADAVQTTSTGNFAVVRNAKVFNVATFRGLNVQGSKGFFKNVIAANNVGNGIDVTGGKNIFWNVNSYNNIKGFMVNNSANNLLLNVLSSNNSDDGIMINNAPATNNFIINSTTSLNVLMGNRITAGSNNYFMNSLIINNHTGTNPGFSNTVGSIDLTILNLISSNNNDNVLSQIQSTGGGSNNRRFMGILRTSNGNCDTGAANDGLTLLCNPWGLSDFGSHATLNFLSGNNPFIAGTPKAGSDSINTNFTSGTFLYDSITNWTSFQNFYRTIGKQNPNTFPDVNLVGRCIATNPCQLHDWSLRKSDPSGVRNIVPCPNNLTRPTLNLNGSIVLRNAYEILGDWKGNDDGLCQAQEECVYTPNIGAYQGHGKLVPASTVNADYPNAINQCANITTATGTDGTVNSIKLFKYEINGY